MNINMTTHGADVKKLSEMVHFSVTVLDVYETILYYLAFATGSIGGFLSSDGTADYFDMVIGTYRKKRLAAKGGIKISAYTLPDPGGLINCNGVWLYKSPSAGWLIGLETGRKPDAALLESLCLVSMGAVGFIRSTTNAASHERDSLTGLFNRGRFYRDLEHLAESLTHKGLPLWLLFIDLNNFKVINDTLGHKMGDRILQSQASNISRSVADSGMAYRYGGDEFCVIVPGVTDKAAVADIVRRIELSSEQAPGGITVTASVGASLYNAGENIEDFIARSDREMYSSKENNKKMLIQRTTKGGG